MEDLMVEEVLIQKLEIELKFLSQDLSILI